MHVDSWRTTYAGIVPDDYLANLSHQKREEEWSKGIASKRDNVFYVVAVNENGQIVGFANGGPERDGVPGYDAELFAIYLLNEYQGQGPGRCLTEAGSNKLGMLLP